MAGRSASDNSSLKRLGGGRWRTRDERFTIEPDSGTWVVVDAEQADDLGLPLVRGPFRSLGDAKDAIAAASTSPPVASPLADRIGRRGKQAEEEPAHSGRASRTPRTAADGKRSGRERAVSATAPGPRRVRKPPSEPAEPVEPPWLAALGPDVRRRARRLIARLEAAGAPDPEGMARRDIVGEVPAVAAFAIERRLDALGPDTDPAAIAGLLADGRDDDLGVRWRLVDDAGRPISIDPKRRLRR